VPRSDRARRDFVGTQLSDRLGARLWCGRGGCGRRRTMPWPAAAVAPAPLGGGAGGLRGLAADITALRGCVDVQVSRAKLVTSGELPSVPCSSADKFISRDEVGCG